MPLITTFLAILAFTHRTISQAPPGSMGQAPPGAMGQAPPGAMGQPGKTAATGQPGKIGATGPAAKAASALSRKANMLDEEFMNYILIICGSLSVALILWRVYIESTKYIRRLTCLNNDTQVYFAKPSQRWGGFKKHMLYAPVFRQRHNREFQLSSVMNVGTLPTRLQLLFLVAYFGTNVTFSVNLISWDQPLSVAAQQLRNRTGILSVVNMIPLFIMAGRNNVLINWLNISFDTFNLLHRWFGRIVVLEAIVHATAWGVATVEQGGWAAVTKAMSGSQFILMGTIAVCGFMAMAFQANSILRHAFYETFKYLHIALAVLVLITLWFHLKLKDLPQMKLLIGVFIIWAGDRIMRILILIYRNGFSGSTALVEALPGNACRVTIDMPRPWNFKAGQHAYLYVPSISGFQSHPFSVSWAEATESLDTEKLALNRQDILAMQKPSMSFVIRERTGFTRSLCTKASGAPDGCFTTKVFAEGPYGGMHSMTSYGTVMLFAGGVGITHQVPHVRNLVAGYANGTVATRKIVLVWIIQSPEHLEWIRPWMTSILAMDRRRDVLRIMLFISRPRSTKEIHSPSSTVQMFPGRPNIGMLVDLEIETQVGGMGISVCGSGALSDDVRRVVRERQDRSMIDFVEEAFSW